MRRNIRSTGLLCLAFLFATAGANAGIVLGDSVDISIHAPTRDEPCFLCGGVTRVEVQEGAADAVEPYLPGDGWFQVNVDPERISIVFNRDVSWGSADFIGLVISDIDWLEGAVRAIPGAVLSAADSNGLLPALAAEMNARLEHSDTSVALNWQGLSVMAGTELTIALQAPEPGALLLLLGLLAVIRFRPVTTV